MEKCELHELYGVCTRGSKCPKSHNVNSQINVGVGIKLILSVLADMGSKVESVVNEMAQVNDKLSNIDRKLEFIKEKADCEEEIVTMELNNIRGALNVHTFAIEHLTGILKSKGISEIHMILTEDNTLPYLESLRNRKNISSEGVDNDIIK